MEQQWANLLEGKDGRKPQNVSVKIKIQYDDINGVSKRPSAFKGSYTSNGKKKPFLIKNSYGG